MAVIKEWICVMHGEFDGSHPICPEMGCDSATVTREFRTAPAFKSDRTKRFDKGVRRSSDSLGGANFRSARAGEASYGGTAQAETGLELLWGDQSRKVLGKSFAELTQMAHRPFPGLKSNNAMRDAANEVGITQRRLPRAGDVAVAREDQKKVAATVTALTT